MEINKSPSVKNGVHGPGKALKIGTVKQEKDKTPAPQATQTEENSGDRISLSETSKNAVSELGSAQATGQIEGKAALSEEDAVGIAQQAAEQLAKTRTAISNQAIQKAVDLFA